MKKNFFIVIAILIVIAIVYVLCSFNTSKTELKSIKNMEELNSFYKGEYARSNDEDIAKKLVTLPFSAMNRINRPIYYESVGSVLDYSSSVKNSLDSLEITPTATETTTTGLSDSSSRDYSTTNIQVENVDEADITKTDGDYIYSISEDNVIITDVKNPEEIKIVARITISDGSIPEDLILYKDKIVVICSNSNNSVSYYKYNTNTVVKIYNIQNRENPRLEKSYTLYEPYYTSRCIEGKLYVISSGTLRKEKNDVITYYTEDNEQKDIGLDNIKYFDEVKTNKQTLISFLNLNDIDKDVKVSSYLMDTSNAYVSEGSIYILNQKYNAQNNNYFGARLKKLFGPLGVIGFFKAEIDYDYDYEYDYGTYTHIYKFSILEDGQIKYANKNSVKGTTINQYSIDEYNNKLRLALYTTDGSRIVVFDDKLEKLGETSYLAKGEKMYSSRFMGNKAYMVTYRTIDPLYVIDLTDSYKPKVLGELKIPGYSTYLHPYDENHLIGIGMETKETINRNSQGKVVSTTARIVGMKMALFDITDVRNPKQISSTVIGDSRTTSAILTNPKALLFSKEKELIAIPINNYAEDFSVSSSDNVSSLISNYTSYNKNYISEGYLVYSINLKDGIKQKGVITHDKDTINKYYYYNISRLLRGLYIDDNLYTVSEDYIKVNRLDNLEEIGKMGITKKAIKRIEQEQIGIEEDENKKDN